MPSLVSRFFRKSRAEQRQFFFTYATTIYFSLIVALIPKKLILQRIGEVGIESALEIPDDRKEVAVLIAKSMLKTVRFAPWTVTCFTRAISAKYLLKRKGLQSTLYVGVAKEGENKLIAHAWLRYGDITVTGKEEMKRFTTVAFFS